MKWSNSEMSIVLREDNIIIIKVNKDVKQLTVPVAKKSVIRIQEAMKLNAQPKVLFFFMAQIYVSKDVIRCYTDAAFGEAGMAVFCESLTAWLVGNIGVTIRRRFMGSEAVAAVPIKAFKKEDEAIEWSLDVLKNAF